MARTQTLAALSALAVAFASPVAAQTLIGDREFDYRISDIEIEAERNIARSTDSARYTFGTGQRSSTGSVSLTYSGNTGNTDTQDFAAGGRYTLRDGD